MGNAVEPKKIICDCFYKSNRRVYSPCSKKIFVILMAALGKMKKAYFSLLPDPMASQIVSFERASNFRDIRFFGKISIFPKSKTLLGLKVSS